MESTATTTAYLSISRSDNVINVPLLGENSWKLGRSSQCAIVLEDDLVSRNHAMIQRMDSKEYSLIDMGSRNGSFVNERRLSGPMPLRDGDGVTLGNAHMVFYNPQETDQCAALELEDDRATVCHFMQCLVSVLVIDIREFTVLSQQLEDAVLCQLTGTWFAEADRIMRSHGSAAEKYIGDAEMAAWRPNRGRGALPEDFAGLEVREELHYDPWTHGWRCGCPELLPRGRRQDKR